MRIEHRKAIDLTDREVLRCNELSFGIEGYMSEDLARILRDERRRKQYRYSHVILLRVRNRIVGWALVQPLYRSRKWTSQLFVDPLHRRKGYGSLLLRESNRYTVRPYCFVDDENVDFFKNNRDICTDYGDLLV